MSERPEIAGRVAWTYLATLLAGVSGGLVAVVAFQFVNPLVCGAPVGDSADRALDCSLVWAMGLWVIGFAGALLGTLAILKLENRLCCWLAMVTGMVALLLTVAWITTWWWWVAAVLLPALAAVASARWSGRAQVLRLQWIGLAVLLGALLAVFTVQVWNS